MGVDISRDDLEAMDDVVIAVEVYFKDLWKRHPEIMENGFEYMFPYMQTLHEKMDDLNPNWKE